MMIENKNPFVETEDAKLFLRILLEKSSEEIVLFDVDRNVIAQSSSAAKRNDPSAKSPEKSFSSVRLGGERSGPPDSAAPKEAFASDETTPVRNAQGRPVGYLYIKRDKNAEKPARDHLTGVVGREGLEEEFSARNQNRGPNDRGMTLVFIDLDRFKPVNEMFGHLVGDQVLLQFAALLKNRFRPADLVARYGGDEFVVLCADCPASVVEKRVHDFQKSLAGQYVKISFPKSGKADERITLGFSFGLTAVTRDDSFASAAERADTRLLKMKHRQKKSVPAPAAVRN